MTGLLERPTVILGARRDGYSDWPTGLCVFLIAIFGHITITAALGKLYDCFI
jgi:hypothetical protein